MSDDALAITVVGAGSVGTNLAVRLDGLGHRVTFGARDLASPKLTAARAAVPEADAVPLAEAADGADIVVLAVPLDGVVPALHDLGDVDGRILIDATNAVGRSLPDGCGSVPDLILRERAGATVVKAFNTVGAEVLLQPVMDGRPAFLPIAGPTPAADAVCGLATAMGFDALVVGDASSARLLEDHARLWIHLALRTGLGRGFGFALVREVEDGS